jgi:hypothetical protein
VSLSRPHADRLTRCLAVAQQRAAVAALWRALAVRLRKTCKAGRDVGLRLRQAYSATSCAESGFALLWAFSASQQYTKKDPQTSAAGLEFSETTSKDLPEVVD